MDKYPLEELFRVNEDTTWRYPGLFGLYRIHNGIREYWDENNGWLPCDCEEDLVKIINHPESIERLPRLTEREVTIMRTVGANWASRDDNPETSDYVDLWRGKPEKEEDTYCSRKGALASITKSLFPSVKEGDCIPLEEVDDG